MEKHPLATAFDNMKEHNRMFSYIAISRLSSKNRTQEGVKFILDHFTALKTTKICEVYTLSNSDSFVFYDKKNEDYIKMMAFRINYYLTGEKIVDLNAFITTYSRDNILNAEELITSSLKNEEKNHAINMDIKTNTSKNNDKTLKGRLFANALSNKITSPAFNKFSHPAEKLLPSTLSKTEQILNRSDITGMIRRQQVCSLISLTSFPVMLFEEVYVSIEEIRSSIIPEITINKENWLFRHLTEVLDKRLLGIISRHDDGSFFKDFSININVSSILSREFTKFDDGISPLARGTIVLEIDAVDIFKDIDFYISARNYVKERGYKICIDGVTNKLLPFVNREKLGADLIKIPWHESYSSESFDRFSIKQNNPEKVILCRIDSSKALKVGKELGVILFQGRYIDTMKGENTIENSINIPSRI